MTANLALSGNIIWPDQAPLISMTWMMSSSMKLPHSVLTMARCACLSSISFDRRCNAYMLMTKTTAKLGCAGNIMRFDQAPLLAMAASPNRGLLLQSHSGDVHWLSSQPDAGLIPLASLPQPCPVLLAAPVAFGSEGEWPPWPQPLAGQHWIPATMAVPCMSYQPAIILCLTHVCASDQCCIFDRLNLVHGFGMRCNGGTAHITPRHPGLQACALLNIKQTAQWKYEYPSVSGYTAV